jgi:hypothetical protein
MPPSSRQPKINAMLLCQKVIREAETNMVSLISIFEAIRVEELPASVPSVVVFAKLTEAQGEYEFKLEVVRRNDNQVIAEAPVPPMSVDDPMLSGEIALDLGGLRFDQAGYYDFRLSANGRFIDSKSLLIELVR